MGKIILDLNLSVSERTLEYAIINELDMGYRIEHKAPWLSKKQKEVRLTFVKEHISWTLKERRRLGFTDEISMQMSANLKSMYRDIQKKNI